MRSLARFYAGSFTVACSTRSCFSLWPFAREPAETRFSCQGADGSIAGCRGVVNMLLYGHGKDTNNHTLRGAGPESDCCSQSVLWSFIRQRCYPVGIAGNGAGDLTAVHRTQAPNKERPFIPQMNQGAFWAVHCKACELQLVPSTREKQERS